MGQAQLKKERRLSRARKARERFQRASDAEARGCLICRRADGGFLSAEHPLPESLGNREIVLPNGVVCDRCNSGVLSDLDQALCEFFPLKMRRTMLGIESKAGKIPHTRFQTGFLRHDGLTQDGQAALYFNINNASDTTTLYEKQRFGNHVELSFNAKGGKPMTPRHCALLSRALLKAAFECAWLDHGEMMLEDRFDHAREAILGKPRDGFFIVGRRLDPDHIGAELQYNFVATEQGDTHIPVAVQFYGIPMATNSRLTAVPIELPSEHFIVVEFAASDMRVAA
jgi:hypothetical protein